MPRFLLLAFLFLSLSISQVLAQTDGLPPRPSPFQFVNDQAQLLSAGDAKKLETGLRRYADETGTQVVVVTVPSLGGREVADYGRALGTAWGVGQRDKNNGVVVLVAAQEHKVTIQAGSGIRDKITPALTQRVINQDFGPNFKQGNYLLGLRKGLSELMLAANPSSDPRKNATATTPATAGANEAAGASGPALNSDRNSPAATPEPAPLPTPVAPAEPSGPGMGTLLLGALGIGAVLWFVVRMFRNRASANTNTGPGNAPNFNPNQPNRPGGAPNFMPGQPQGGNYGPGYGNNTPNFMGGGGSGPGIGGMLATGAAAAAGAYIGNRMAGGGHDASANDYSQQHNPGLGGVGGAGLGGAAAGAGAGVSGDDYFANREAGTNNDAADYFSDDNSTANNGDYFSNDSGSYDDTSSADTGGGGFDGGDNNSGSW